jgi:hypothetical protein
VKEPEGNPVICRFMDFEKFRDLFANEEIYLRRVDLFKETDPEEAMHSEAFIRAQMRLQCFVLEDEVTVKDHRAYNRQFSETSYINCWQIFEGETLHMWKSYGQGVAVFSTFKLLKSAVRNFLDTVHLGVVRYGGPEDANLINALFRKRNLFDKERELRLVIQSLNPMAGMNRHFDSRNVTNAEPVDEENPLPPWVHKKKKRRVDLKALVTEVRLSPWATNEQFEEVGWWIKNSNVTCPITHSECESAFAPTLEELRARNL